MFDTFDEQVASHNLLNHNQSGFCPEDSIISELLSIVTTIFEPFDWNPPLDFRSICLHMSKAFDIVKH